MGKNLRCSQVYLMQIDKSAVFFPKLAAIFFILFLFIIQILFTTFIFALISIHRMVEREKNIFWTLNDDENHRRYCSSDGQMILSKTHLWRSQLLPIQLQRPKKNTWMCFLIKIYYAAVKCTVG